MKNFLEPLKLHRTWLVRTFSANKANSVFGIGYKYMI